MLLDFCYVKSTLSEKPVRKFTKDSSIIILGDSRGAYSSGGNWGKFHNRFHPSFFKLSSFIFLLGFLTLAVYYVHLLFFLCSLGFNRRRIEIICTGLWIWSNCLLQSLFFLTRSSSEKQSPVLTRRKRASQEPLTSRILIIL